MSIRSRLAALVKRQPATPPILWSNLTCPVEEIEPDASGIDWLELRTNPKPWTREACPIEAAIRAATDLAPSSPQEVRDER